jgi:hypothetical protein
MLQEYVCNEIDAHVTDELLDWSDREQFKCFETESDGVSMLDVKVQVQLQ